MSNRLVSVYQLGPYPQHLFRVHSLAAFHWHSVCMLSLLLVHIPHQHVAVLLFSFPTCSSIARVGKFWGHPWFISRVFWDVGAQGVSLFGETWD